MRLITTKNIFNKLEDYIEDGSLPLSNPSILLKTSWDYKNPIKIEDVDLWEIIYENGEGLGIYASYIPYIEFYMIKVGWLLEAKGYGVETYYGPGSQKEVIKRAKELEIPLNINKKWVEPDDMWLYEN